MKHTRIVRKATYMIGFTSIVLGVLFISGLLIYKTWFLPDSVICEQWVPSTIYPITLSGTVLSVVSDPLSTDTCRIQIEIENFGSLLWCNCSSHPLENTRITPGDSIQKGPNSLLVTICSPSSACATFEFPCCD